MITPGRRPVVDEVRAYYSRPEILNEILQAMQRWHVRFVPGYSRQSWLYTEDPGELQARLMQPLDLMEQESERTEYPYFRINWARYTPAPSWEDDALWGYDFVIEKDSFLWQECFEAMLPVMDILEYFGVYYWLKYTGHHSLHLVIPAECFPRTVRGVPLTEAREVVYHRLMVFLNKRARQHYNEHNRHCPPGTNMPYSVNEDTGLLNTPLLREELATFRPWQASLYLVQVRDFWRTVPESAYGCAVGLLDEVLKPYERQARFYPPERKKHRDTEHTEETAKATKALLGRCDSWVRSNGFSRSETAKAVITNRNFDLLSMGERRLAIWQLMLNADVDDLPVFIAALADDDADTRWFAVEAVARIGPPDVLPSLLAMRTHSVPGFPHDMAGACLVDFCVRHGEAVIPALVEALKDFKAPWSSLPVDRALVRIGEASVPYLQALLDDPNPNARKQAFITLERINGTPSLDDVLSMSTRHNRMHDAAQMLGWYDEPRAYRRIAELAEVPRNARARRNAIKALLWIDHPQAQMLLQRALDDENTKVRRWAEEGVKLYGVMARLGVYG